MTYNVSMGTLNPTIPILRQIRIVSRLIRRSVTTVAGHITGTATVDYGNATLTGLLNNQLGRLQSVMNAAARIVFSARKYEHITPLLRDLHWLRAPQRIEFKLAGFRCLHAAIPIELRLVADIDLWRRLRSAVHICARRAIDASCHHWRPCLWRLRCARLEHSVGRR